MAATTAVATKLGLRAPKQKALDWTKRREQEGKSPPSWVEEGKTGEGLPRLGLFESVVLAAAAAAAAVVVHHQSAF